MVFSSVIFFCYFLPIMIAGYYILPGKVRNIWLLLGSLFFYAWGEPKYIFIMIASIAGNYLFGMLIHYFALKEDHGFSNYGLKLAGAEEGMDSSEAIDSRDRSAGSEKGNTAKKITLIVTILYNLGILFYFKYFNLFMETVNNVLNKEISWVEVALPIGISFYTFQGMSYVIDVYRGDCLHDRNGNRIELVQKNPINLALYISMFPQLIAGPIVRYTDIREYLEHRITNSDTFAKGAERFIVGLAKKAILANSIGEIADKIFTGDYQYMGRGVAWLGAICYTLQIYYDFSGYSDMAIGLGKIFGFDFLENFNYPYISGSITEFWRRWHISLSSWFRDYLYIPLGGNRRGNVYVNLIIVFIATGIWHGAAWSFLIWGLWHGLFMLIERYFRKNGKVNPFTRVPAPVKWLYTIIIVMLGWVLFKLENVADTLRYICAMFRIGHIPYTEFSVRYYLDNKMIVLLLAAVIACIPWGSLCSGRKNKLEIFVSEFAYAQPGSGACVLRRTVLVILLFISMLFIVNSTYNPFIYFRF
ncbi:MAG: MBOAT family protein [Lachnospiraceae bacterium]|nr:MBOAT family protein [Lachnospiraceae bacterium]